MERAWRIIRHALDVDRQAAVDARLVDKRQHLAVHGVEQCVVHVAQVDAEFHFARYHVAAVGKQLHHADRAAAVRRVAVGDRHHFLHDAGRHLQRVAAQSHRRRSRVRLHSRHHAVVPRQAHHRRHHADHLVGVFQHRPLLDVGFEIRADRMLARHLLAQVADARQFVPHRLALEVFRRVRRLEAEGAAKHARTHHHRHEARAFLVGPDRDLDRRLGRDVQIVQRAHHFQPGQHAVIAVELAAGRLGVDVAAGDDRRQRGIAAVAAHEDVADPVDRDRQARVPRPADDQVAALSVEVGQRQALDAPFWRGADARQFHQGCPQAVAVDAKLVHRCSPFRVRC